MVESPTYAPMLASLGTLEEVEAQAQHGWAFEFKWDGIRALLHNDADKLRILTRNGNDVRRTFPELAQIRSALGRRDAVVDGEIVALDAGGRPDFGLLQQRLHIVDPHTVRQRAHHTPVVFLAFDVLRLDGVEMLRSPYTERRVALESMDLSGPHWDTPAYHVDAGRALISVSRERGMEGVIAKRLQSAYRPGQRTRDWIKIKHTTRQEFVVGGWTEGQGSRSGSFGALLVGAHDTDGELVFAGAVGSGFNDLVLTALRRQLETLSTADCPFRQAPAAPRAHWVRPQLVAEVEYRGWTQHAHLRAPVFLGLRSDKRPGEVLLEPAPPVQDVMHHA